VSAALEELSNDFLAWAAWLTKAPREYKLVVYMEEVRMALQYLSEW
jgi:hypothetical protein